MATFLNTRFNGYAEIPADARCGVVVVHGLADYADRFSTMVSDLARCGVASFAFDLAGHGAMAARGSDPGSRTHIDRFDQYVDELCEAWAAVRAAYPEMPLFLWGHSMGAIVATLGVSRMLDGLRGVITTSAPIDSFRGPRKLLVPIVTAWARLFPQQRRSIEIRAEQLSTLASVGEAYIRDPLVPTTASVRLLSQLAHASAHALSLAPTLRNPWLVLHGDADRIAPASGSRRFFEQLASPDKHIQVFPGLRHELHNEREPERSQLIDLLCQWIEVRSRA